MYTYNAKVHRVIDGDTVDLVVDLGFSVSTTVRFRLDGIDAPELTVAEREAGLRSKVALGLLLASAQGGIISVVSKGKDKYGRWVATLSFVRSSDGCVVDVSKQMIAEGHAVVAAY